MNMRVQLEPDQLNEMERHHLRTIIQRAEIYNLFYWGKLELQMDLTAVHLNGCPLNFDELAGAEGGDFIHDVSGIQRHLDRETGQLMDCWRPRYAQEQ